MPKHILNKVMNCHELVKLLQKEIIDPCVGPLRGFGGGGPAGQQLFSGRLDPRGVSVL